MVTSPHHLGATMVTERTHRMTELFGRLAPGASVEDARAELTAVHAAMMREHPEAYSSNADMRLSVTPLRKQITAPARTILLVLLAAAASGLRHRVLERRELDPGALGAPRRRARGARRARREPRRASADAARRESRALRRRRGAGRAPRAAARRGRGAVCRALFRARARRGGGRAACSGSAPAWPSRRRYCSRTFRGCRRRTRQPGSTLAAAACGSRPARIAGCARSRRCKSRFRSCCSPARAHCSPTLVALQRGETGYDMRQVLAIDLPTPSTGHRQCGGDGLLPGADAARQRTAGRGPSRARKLRAVAGRWRSRSGFSSRPMATRRADGEENPHARLRWSRPAFRRARRADHRRPRLLRRRHTWQRAGRRSSARASRSGCSRTATRRAPGLVDRSVLRQAAPAPHRRRRGRRGRRARRPGGPASTIYHPVQQMRVAGRLFVHATGDPYALVPEVTRVIHDMSADQPVERAATLEDVRAEVLAPERLKAFVVAGFAGVALLIAVVGVSGVLAFSVSARHARIRRAAGRRLITASSAGRRLSEGAVIVAMALPSAPRAGTRLRAIARATRERPFPGRVAVPRRAAVLGGGAPRLAAACRASVARRRAPGVAIGKVRRSRMPLP